jgi:hypothetical protein
MHTITSLRKALTLTTTNQVRNRIEAIRDVLEPHLRRGPNNQILVADDGLALLRQLQELYDSGLTMTEASDVLRATSIEKNVFRPTGMTGFVQDRTNQNEGEHAVVAALQSEVTFLRSRVAGLEGRLTPSEGGAETSAIPWWTTLREDVDVA